MLISYPAIVEATGLVYGGSTVWCTIQKHGGGDVDDWLAWNPSTEEWTGAGLIEIAMSTDATGEVWTYYFDHATALEDISCSYLRVTCYDDEGTCHVQDQMLEAPDWPVTAAEVIAEGQFQLVYFPNCATQAALNAFLEERIADADAQVRIEIGANYESTSSQVQRLIKRMVLFGTMVDCWQIIKNVMDSYDAEALPPEFVEPDQAAANRDYYLGRLERLLAKYDATPGGKSMIGAWRSGGVDEDEETVLGVNY